MGQVEIQVLAGHKGVVLSNVRGGLVGRHSLTSRLGMCTPYWLVEAYTLNICLYAPMVQGLRSNT